MDEIGTVSRLKQEKKVLEQSILHLIESFEQVNGCKVSSIGFLDEYEFENGYKERSVKVVVEI